MFVRQRFYEMRGQAIKKTELSEIVDHIAAEAMFKGEQADVFLRTAEHEGRFYLDLATADWKVVEIDSHGWRIVARSNSASAALF